MLAFAAYHAGAQGRRANVGRFVAGGLLAALGVYWLLAVEGGAGIGVTLIVLAAFFVLVAPRAARNRQARHLLKQHGQGGDRSVVGQHRLGIEPDGLLARSPYGEGKIGWDRVARIAAADDHTFIYLADRQVVVIPRRGVSGGSYDAFVDALRGRVDAGE